MTNAGGGARVYASCRLPVCYDGNCYRCRIENAPLVESESAAEPPYNPRTGRFEAPAADEGPSALDGGAVGGGSREQTGWTGGEITDALLV